MAIRTNTTKTIERASSALLGKCEATEKNMDKLLAQAGCGGSVYALMRAGYGTGKSLYASISHDGGQTFSPPAPSSISP